jgi:hypothetical protein
MTETEAPLTRLWNQMVRAETSTWRKTVLMKFIRRIATSGVMSIIAIRGTTLRSGARIGSVTSYRRMTSRLPGGRLNHERSARTMIARLRMLNSRSTKLRSQFIGMVVLQRWRDRCAQS